MLLEELEALGELENTLLVVSGDHGIPGVPRAKCNLYDIGCEVALAARWPGKIAPGRVVHDFVNIMDLAPTFCEAGGVPPPAGNSAIVAEFPFENLPLLAWTLSKIRSNRDDGEEFIAATARPPERSDHKQARESMLFSTV